MSESMVPSVCGGSAASNPSCSSGPEAGACSPPGPCLSGNLQSTPGGSRVNVRAVSAYFMYSSSYETYSAGASSSKECGRIPLQSGGSLKINWTRLSGQQPTYSSYADSWMPAGASAAFSFLPRVNLTMAGGQPRVFSDAGPLTYDVTGAPRAQLPQIANYGTTYFTTYDQVCGVYFEYFAGTGLALNDPKFGRLNRRIDSSGNFLQYNYSNNAQGNALLRSITGDVGGNLVPYFEYQDETIDSIRHAPITKINLVDRSNPSVSRTTYFEYTYYNYPYLSKVINANGCVVQYDPIFPFASANSVYQLKRDIDAEGYQTYFNYSGGVLTRVDEPEGRTTYYEYVTNETRQIQPGRTERHTEYGVNTTGDGLTEVTRDTNPLLESSYFDYDATLGRITTGTEPNANETRYEYAGTSNNKYALSKIRSTLNGAETYFGYATGADGLPSYDVAKMFSPRHVAGSFAVVSYFAYNSQRKRTSTADPLGNETLWDYDNLGRVTKQRNARGFSTYFSYGSSGGLVSAVDALGNQSLYTVNSFLERTAETSPRGGASVEWTTYFEYDQLGRKTKKVDRQSNVTYFDWTSRCDLSDFVDPLGTVTAHTYDGLRRRTQTTVTDSSGTLLSRTKDGFDIYGNRDRTQDGLGNTTYFSFNEVNRLTAQKDALSNLTYFFYDKVGNKTVQQDARNNPSYFFYDQMSRQTASRNALGNPTYYFYDLANNRTHVVDARNNTTYFFFDQLNRRNATRDALANPTYFFYDQASNPTATRDALGRPTYYAYDALDRKTAHQNALGQTTYYTFDAEGNQTSVTDALLKTTTHTYDTLNRLVLTVDALSQPNYFGYDAVGNRTRMLDARFNVTYYFYDGMRRQTATRDALGNASYFFYDLAGNQTVTLNALLAPTYFGYDALNRRSVTQDALGNVTYFTFDAVGNQTKVMDARGNSNTSSFDAVNRITASADALSNTSYYFYDAVGNQSCVLDARLKPTYFGYDALNRRTVTQDALGNCTYYTYDAVGNQPRVIDARGNSPYFVFDALNRKSLVEDALGNVTLSSYDAVGNLTAEDRGQVGYGRQPYGTSAYGGVLGVTTYYFYDALNRRSATRDALAGYSYFFYDTVGNQSALRNPLLHLTYFGYDALNRRVRTQDPLGFVTYYEYDAVGNQTRMIDPDGHATVTGYDLLNRQTAVFKPDSGAAYFFYDATSNRTAELDPLLNPTYFGFDAVNRPVRIQDALGKTVYFEYDPVGSPSRFIDSEGASITNTYDAVNRRTNVAYATAGTVVSDGLRSDPYYVYDQVGNLTQMGDLWGLHRMGYDADNRITQHQYPNSNVIYFRYDSRHNMTARVYPGSSGTSTAGYDSLDRQTLVQAPSGATAYFTYDAASNQTQRVLGNNAKLDATYDAAERAQTWRYSKASGAPLAYFDYTRDAKGLISKTVREASYATYFTYDACDRLTAEVWTTVGASPSEVYGYRYAYDLAGNRTKALVNGQATYYTYDRANQLTVKGTNAVYATPTYYYYDQNGSLTELVEPTGTTKFAYNAAGLIARMKWKDASATYFFYDGNLRRHALRQNGTLNYFIWDGMDLLQEQNADGTVKEEYTQAKTSAPGIGQLLETYRPGVSPDKIYPVMDPRGTILKWLRSNGTTVEASREYDAFGNLIPNAASGTWPGIFSYQGQAWHEILSADGAQRLLLSPTRIYHPSEGRFFSRDPLASKSPAGRHTSNLYEYAMSNPVTAVDPDGRDIWLPDNYVYHDEMGNEVSQGNGGYWRYYYAYHGGEPSQAWDAAARAASGGRIYSSYSIVEVQEGSWKAKRVKYAIWTPVYVPEPDPTIAYWGSPPPPQIPVPPVTIPVNTGGGDPNPGVTVPTQGGPGPGNVDNTNLPTWSQFWRNPTFAANCKDPLCAATTAAGNYGKARLVETWYYACDRLDRVQRYMELFIAGVVTGKEIPQVNTPAHLALIKANPVAVLDGFIKALKKCKGGTQFEWFERDKTKPSVFNTTWVAGIGVFWNSNIYLGDSFCSVDQTSHVKQLAHEILHYLDWKDGGPEPFDPETWQDFMDGYEDAYNKFREKNPNNPTVTRAPKG